MKVLTTSLSQISGGFTEENKQALMQLAASYSGIVALSTPFFLISGNTLAASLIFSLLVTPALGIGGSLLGTTVYAYGPQWFEQLASTNTTTPNVTPN